MTQPVYPLANAQTAERRKQLAPGINDAFQELSVGNDSGDRDDAPLAVLSKPHTYRAERRGTTRGALHKMLHDARGKLRAEPAMSGFSDE
ncbi:MAG: hypothetical protein ACRDL1_00600 [Solirubrobacterales bacterium]